MFFRGKSDADEQPPVYGSEKIEEGLYTNDTGASFTSKQVVDLQEGTKRGLDARHVQMIALGGTIGYLDIARQHDWHWID